MSLLLFTQKDWPGWPDAEWLKRVSVSLAVLLVPAMGMHGWPFDQAAGMQFVWLGNVIVLAWGCCVALAGSRKEVRSQLGIVLPPACVWAYLVLCALSVSASHHVPRATTAAAKLVICLVGTYTLVAYAGRALRNRGLLLWLLSIVTTGVVAYAAMQSLRTSTPTALFQSHLKLGSYLAMAVPCSAVFLAVQPRRMIKAWALMLVVTSLCTSASAWGWAGILGGTIMGALATSSLRAWLTATLLFCVAVTSTMSMRGGESNVVPDMQVLEENGQDVRQRYLEWQALVNLLKNHSAAGTGAGCLNDRRSEYYSRLPKNNTIAAFDQNGYLATAAEIGLPGLAALCWIIGEYLARGWRERADPSIGAAWAGIVGVTIAQVGSSLTYNGIVVVFAFLLAVMDFREPRTSDLA